MHFGLEAGIGRACITPALTVPHAGWGAQTHLLADGVHDDLYVTVLILRQGETSAVIVELDLVGVYALALEIRDRVSAETGIPPDNVRVVVTHNHANPVMWENYGGARPEQVLAYKATLPDKAAGAALQAMRSLKPARLKAGRGRCHIARNRRQRLSDGRMVVGRNDEGIYDPDLFVVRIDGLEGRPLAAIMGYACHPTTLGPDNRLHSPDYPGVAKKKFTEATGVPCLFLQGATGNVGPVMGFTEDLTVVERLGAILGLEAASVFHGINTRPVREVFDRVRESGASLGIWKEELVPEPMMQLQVRRAPLLVPLRVHPLPGHIQPEYDRLKAELARVTGDGSPAEVVEGTMFRMRRAQMAMTRAKAYGGKTHLELEMHLLAFGEVAIVGINGEPFVQMGLAVKASSPFPYTFFGGYTGIPYGYIPWPDEYPDGGYEVETSPFSPEVAPLIVRTALEHLSEMADERV